MPTPKAQTEQPERRRRYFDEHPILSWMLPFFLFDALFSGGRQDTALANAEEQSTDADTHAPANEREQNDPEAATMTTAKAGTDTAETGADTNMDAGAADSQDSFASGSFDAGGSSFDGGSFDSSF